MYIDLFFALFVIYGFVVGYNRGIIRTIISIASFLIALIAALKFSPILVNFLEHAVQLDPLVALIAGLLLTFFLIMWGIRLIGRSLETMLKKVRLNFLNRLLGGALYTLLMVLCFGAIIWFLDMTDTIPDHQKAGSRSYIYLKELPEISRDAVAHLKPVFREFWEKVEEVMDGDPPQEG